MKIVPKPITSWLFEILPLTRAQPCSPCTHSHFQAPNQNSQPEGQNHPKYKLLDKTMIWTQNWILLVKMSLKVCSIFQNKSSEADKVKGHIKWRNRLPQKMCFSTIDCLANMILQLDSWHQKKSGNGLRFWFRVPVSHVQKMRQTLISNLISKDAIFETSPNLGKLYINGKHFWSWVWIKIITFQFITDWPKNGWEVPDTVMGH